MRVLLTQPPLVPGHEVSPPLGLCTLGAWLHSNGHEVHILDLDLEVKSSRAPAAEFEDLFARAFREFEPQAAGFTSMYSNSLQAERLIRVSKRLNSGVATIAGGSHFGALATQALARIPELDFAIQGEAEEALATLLGGLEQGADPACSPRLHYRRDGTIASTPPVPLMDLASLPPIWESLDGAIDLARYPRTIPRSAARRIMYVEAGRGCPFRCTFCATAPFWEQRYRVKPADRIAAELRFLHDELGYDSFILVHDLLTANLRFISHFCDVMLDARLPVEWMANSRSDVRLRGLLPKMKAAGCWKLFHGIETASPRLQITIDKHLPVDDVTDSMRELLDNGIGATCSFVIGLPDETAEDLSATIALGAGLKLAGVETVQLHRLRLFPPAPLTRQHLAGQFDLDSLRIEYPFVEVAEVDLQAIQIDRGFFSGYWTPDSPAGTAEQLAQVEMFFHHVLALAPLTIASAAQFAGPALVSAFYEALAASTPVQRADIDWEDGHLWENWLAFAPLLDRWIDTLATAGWQREVLRGLKEYEEQRLRFSQARSTGEHAFAAGEEWAAIDVRLDMEIAIESLRAKRLLTPAVLREGVVVFTRASGAIAAFVLDTCWKDELVCGDPRLLAQFGRSALR